MDGGVPQTRVGELDAGTLVDHVEGPGLALLEVHAPDCGPCHLMSAVVDRVAAKCTGVRVARLDASTQGPLAQALGVVALPTLMLFRDGALVLSRAGALPEHILVGLLEKARSLETPVR